MRYYIVDYGKDMIDAGRKMCEHLTAQGYHYVVYLTDADGLLCCEEITEDEFLDHFKHYKNTN